MAPKPAEKQQALPEAKPKPFATSYAGGRKDGVWRVYRIDLHEDGKGVRVEVTPVLEHPSRLVVRERLVTRLMSREVLP